jgi:hypothetical protein
MRKFLFNKGLHVLKCVGLLQKLFQFWNSLAQLAR